MICAIGGGTMNDSGYCYTDEEHGLYDARVCARCMMEHSDKYYGTDCANSVHIRQHYGDRIPECDKSRPAVSSEFDRETAIERRDLKRRIRILVSELGLVNPITDAIKHDVSALRRLRAGFEVRYLDKKGGFLVVFSIQDSGIYCSVPCAGPDADVEIMQWAPGKQIECDRPGCTNRIG